MAEKILVVDDETQYRGMLVEALSAKGFEVSWCGSAEESVALVRAGDYDIVLHDVKLPGISGLDAIPLIKEADPLTDIIIMTGHGSKETGVEAMKIGAYDYFTKPFSLTEMEVVIRRALEKRRLSNEVAGLKKTLGKEGPQGRIIGQSKAMRRVISLVERVAAMDATVLVLGETGTGKELISDTIQAMSLRADKPFVKLNCAAIPENLLESELFGHEKGAFTGATSAKQGKFEMADGGTIMLDEIGDMPLHLQPKLLRAVEQKQVERLGGSKPIAFDVRIIAATNQGLAEQVAAKKFRSDLYYRLNVAAITLPPLRLRKDDIPLLAEKFIEAINIKLGTQVHGIGPGAAAIMHDYDWPGNVRQLANTLERAVIFCTDERLGREDMELALHQGPGEPDGTRGMLAAQEDAVPPIHDPAMTAPVTIAPVTIPPIPVNTAAPPSQLDFSKPLKAQLQAHERMLIQAALARTDGVQIEAATLLGISPTNLSNKIKKHGIAG